MVDGGRRVHRVSLDLAADENRRRTCSKSIGGFADGTNSRQLQTIAATSVLGIQSAELDLAVSALRQLKCFHATPTIELAVFGTELLRAFGADVLERPSDVRG